MTNKSAGTSFADAVDRAGEHIRACIREDMNQRENAALYRALDRARAMMSKAPVSASQEREAREAFVAAMHAVPGPRPKPGFYSTRYDETIYLKTLDGARKIAEEKGYTGIVRQIDIAARCIAVEAFFVEEVQVMTQLPVRAESVPAVLRKQEPHI